MRILFPVFAYLAVCIMANTSTEKESETSSKIEEPEKPADIPLIFLRGSHYEVGKQVGKVFKKPIKKALKENYSLKSKLLPFYETEAGKTAYNQLLSASEEHLPQYVEEIRGIAEAAKVDFVELFLIHIDDELMSIMPNQESKSPSPKEDEGCSDFQINNENWAIHTHSEDVDPVNADPSPIWMAEISSTDEDGEEQRESFIAYAYTGMIPGFAWGINSYGLFISGNVVNQKRTFVKGMIPRKLLTRALLKEKSIDDFIDALTSLPGGGMGFNFMLSQRVCKEDKPGCVRMVGVEYVGSIKGNEVHVKETDKFGYHFNEYKYLDVECISGPSNKAREERLEEFKEEFGENPSNLQQLKHIMSDTKMDYPFFRTASPPDRAATANVVFVNMRTEVMSVYRQKPSESEPYEALDIAPWKEDILKLNEMIFAPTPEMIRDEL